MKRNEQIKVLEQMADQLTIANKQAEKALAEADAELSKTLKQLKEKK